ncbi:DNA cytosine methyltransferase [Idiomarina abyssalis]|uniref:DNA cytosine methyltransferase n=1 Tax=Idiomarina abyssalis TaxID=86102 RepID=UPI001C98D322|nr:DNA cytosine methyltransferase [Idiomarina abyssalis]QZN90853.1 DNA cytosine methyltransferase [Idiomarina abyssalis]
MTNFLDVKHATEILKEHGLASDIDSTRRFIRLNELPAEKDSNFSGYRISRRALDAFIWVKTNKTPNIVQHIMEQGSLYSSANQIKSTNPYRVASFFAGIGGFDLGCERAGMSVVFQCEINKFCQQVLKKNWPKTLLAADIKQLNADDIPDSNIWCGGFPCQDLSLANQGKRKGLEGERSGLFYKYSELIEAKRPSWVIIENVPGLLNSNGGEDFRLLLERMDELGYGVSWRVLDAKYFGTPQRRRRVYIVASLGNLRSSEVLFEPGATTITDKPGIGEKKRATPRDASRIRAADCYSIQHAGIGRKHTAGPQAKGYRNDGETYTLDSRGSADAVCSTNDAFRIRETSGLSSKLDSSRYRAIGNAVAVPIVEWIASRIIVVDSSNPG